MRQQLHTAVPTNCVQSGSSEGVVVRHSDLPEAARVRGEAGDRVLLRLLGQSGADGQAGGGTATVAVVWESARPATDVDYQLGRAAIDKGMVDWSALGGSLSAAVAAFAVRTGLIHKERIPHTGTVTVRMWQVNIGKSVAATVPIVDGQVREGGEVELDGVRVPAAEVRLEFIDPTVQTGQGGCAVFPTGQLIDELEVPGIGPLKATFINAGAPTMLVNAADLGYTGRELPEAINTKIEALAAFEQVRACGALRMGLIAHVEDPARHRKLPELVLVAPPAGYLTSAGQCVAAGEVDLLVRPLAMGRLCHALSETATVAVASAAAIPGTLASLATGGQRPGALRLGSPSGIVRAGADARQILHEWIVIKAVVNGSVRHARKAPPSH